MPLRTPRIAGAPTEHPISPRDPRLLAWRSVLTAHARIVERLDRDLRRECGMSLADYSALLQLAEAPGRRLRMSELAEGIFLTRSGVTRLIDRLQTQGWVTRRQCAADGRGAEAVLTDPGLAMLRAASRTHLRGIKAYFLDRVTQDELEALARVMGSVADGLAARADGLAPPRGSDLA